MFIPFELDQNSNLITVTKNLFTKEECEIIIDYCNKKQKKIAQISTERIINKHIRKNKIVWINIEDISLTWAIKRISDYVYRINKENYNFDIYGLTEDIQFTEYSEIDDHYDWHTDCSQGNIVRKLSFSIQLSDSKDYEGCEIQFNYNEKSENKNDDAKQQGSAISFPSYMSHQVTPLISGKRYSLVVWVGGPNFK